jgi:capsular polysaccharide transport system permease protein
MTATPAEAGTRNTAFSARPPEAPGGRMWFSAGLTNQAHVIGALILRELHTRYGRNNIGYLWVIAEPMLLATSVAAIHAGSKIHYGPDLRPVPFALGGYCVFILFRSILTRSESTLEANRPLLYHRRVTIFDMLFARAALEAASTACAFAILLGGAVVAGLASIPARPLTLMAAVGLMLWFSWALSMSICAAAHASHAVSRLVHPLLYLSMPLSGAFFMLKWLPQPYRDWLSWSPLVQIFEMLHQGQFASVDSPYIRPIYILGWCLGLTMIGLLAIRVTRRHLTLH